MSNELVKRILDLYGLEARAVQAAQKGYRNHSYAAKLADGQIVNLIIYKREPGILQKIQNAHCVADFLAGQGLPARQTLSPRVVTMRADEYIKYAALYNYLPGATIPWEAYTMKHIKQLGATMSDMHALLKPLARGDLPSAAEEYQMLAARMQRYFAQPGVRAALAQKLTLKTPQIVFDLGRYAKLPNQQPLHMDFVRGNLLFSPDKKAQIVGILDFEKAAWGHPVFDIARTLAFLLVDCKYKEEPKVRKYFLHSGYNKRGQSSFADWELLEPLVNFFLLHDFYKFLHHNPYESLSANEHFVRTRNLLFS